MDEIDMTHEALDAALWRFRRRLPERARLYVAGCTGEPLALAGFLQRHPEWANGVTFAGVWIPGVNTTDWASFHPDAASEGIFASPDFTRSFAQSKFSLLPLSYTQAVRWLDASAWDGGIILTTPPDGTRTVSLGLSADFSPILLGRPDIPLLAIAAEAMPRPLHSVHAPVERFSELVIDSTPLRTVGDAGLSEEYRRIGAAISELVDDRSTLQFGLGNVQQAVLNALTGHKRLRVHSGMVSTPILRLIDDGVILNQPGAIVTGVAIGTQVLYERLAGLSIVDFKPVSYTHHHSTLAQIDRFVAINSCISVDLFGQANAEFIADRQVSGVGGLVDFLRGASAATDGTGIVALLSTAKGGTISRIVPRLPPNAVSIARGDMDTVVTEHGVARLKGQSIDRRAEALIQIADPSHRPALAEAWAKIRKDMA